MIDNKFIIDTAHRLFNLCHIMLARRRVRLMHDVAVIYWLLIVLRFVTYLINVIRGVSRPAEPPPLP
jgi:hypothetical protein